MKKIVGFIVLLNNCIFSIGHTDDNNNDTSIAVGAGLGALALGGGAVAGGTVYSKNKTKKQAILEKAKQLKAHATAAKFDHQGQERKNIQYEAFKAAANRPSSYENYMKKEGQDTPSSLEEHQKNVQARENTRRKLEENYAKGEAHDQFIEQHSGHATSILNAKTVQEKNQAVSDYHDFLDKNQEHINKSPESEKLTKMVKETHKTLEISQSAPAKRENRERTRAEPRARTRE